MLVSMSDKELKRLSVLQEICDQRITQSQAAQLLHISERQIRRLLQKYKAQGPAALAHAGRGQISNSKLPEELRLKCLNIVSDQLHGFGPTLAHEKLTTVHGFDLSVETLRSWMIAADLWIPRSKRLKLTTNVLHLGFESAFYKIGDYSNLVLVLTELYKIIVILFTVSNLNKCLNYLVGIYRLVC